MRKNIRITDKYIKLREPFNMVDEHVVGIEAVQMLFFIANAKPRRGPSLSSLVLGSAIYVNAFVSGFLVSIISRRVESPRFV